MGGWSSTLGPPGCSSCVHGANKEFLTLREGEPQKVTSYFHGWLVSGRSLRGIKGSPRHPNITQNFVKARSHSISLDLHVNVMIPVYGRGDRDAQRTRGFKLKQLVPNGAEVDRSTLCRCSLCASHDGRHCGTCRRHHTPEGNACGEHGGLSPVGGGDG